MRNDYGIPISSRDTTEQLFAVRALEVFFAGSEDVGARIKREQFSRELAEHVVGHGEQWLPRKTEPLQLHCRGNHRVCLSSADDVGDQRVWCLHNSAVTGFLVLLQCDGLTGAWQR